MARPIRSIEVYLPLDSNDGRPIPESKYVALQQELLNRLVASRRFSARSPAGCLAVRPGRLP